MNDLRSRLAAALGDAYKLQDELGGGGMSRVFLAEEVQLGRQVVVKVLPPELGAGVNAERFRREIQLAARLQHPHVVPLIAAGQGGELFWYTMPFIKGESLRARLSREHELPVGDAVRILRDVADALNYAHEQGVVHRDIKPDNILISGHHAVVTDFGVAKAISAASGPSSLTSVGVALGTPAYMAPEQASADPQTDHRADIYALGAVAYEILTGKPPFEGPPPAVLAAHVTKAPTPVSDQRASIPPALAALVMKCLEKRPADRYQAASELHALLDAMATPSGGTQPTSAVPATTRAAGRPRRWPRFAAIAAAVVVVGAIGVMMMNARPSGSVIRQAARMAIMPFGSPTADSTLAALGRNLVVLVSASLDGVGEIRMVEPTTVLARTTSAPTLDDAVSHARALGAASVVHGTLVSLGRDVRLDAALYDVETRAVIARANATAPVGNMAQLADSTAWSLLTAVWRARGSPTVSDDALTGRPLAAVREFVEGERKLAISEWDAAAEHYERAIAADSTFWLAYRRYSFSRAWALRPVASSYIETYRAHRMELPARERDLVIALMTTGIGPRTDSLRALAARYPDFWPAWLEYGDILFHHAPATGIRAEQIVEPWEHLRRILPSFRPTYEHLVVARSALGDSAAVHEAIAEWRALGGDRDSTLATAVFVLFTSIARLRVDDPVVDGALVDSVLRAAAAAGNTPTFANSLLTEVGFGREVAASIERTKLTGVELLAFRRVVAFAHAQRGEWSIAVDALSRLRGDAVLDAYEYAAIGRALDGVDSTTRFSMSAIARPLVSSENEKLRVAWADGLAAYARNDRAALSAARQAAATPARRSAYVQSALEFLQQDQGGDRAAATDGLLALERQYADSAVVAPQTAMPVLRVLLARWLLSSRRATEAAWALEVFEERSSSASLQAALGTLGPVAEFHRGVAAEALGEPARARRFYRRFVNGYDSPPPQQRAWVESARSALTRLRK